MEKIVSICCAAQLSNSAIRARLILSKAGTSEKNLAWLETFQKMERMDTVVISLFHSSFCPAGSGEGYGSLLTQRHGVFTAGCTSQRKLKANSSPIPLDAIST